MIRRESKRGAGMVADVEKQDTPLMAMAATEPRTLDADIVNEYINSDNDDGIRRLLQESGSISVWRPRPRAAQASHITSSLHTAAKKGAVKCLKALLDASPPQEILDIPDHVGKTPLMVAVAEAQPQAVRMLLKAGAHVNARNDNGLSCLHLLVFSIQKGEIAEETLQEIVDLLLSHSDIDLEPHNDSNLTPLGLAAKRIPPSDKAPRPSGLITYCKKLVQAGASLTEKAEHSTIEEVLQQKKAHTAVLMGIVPGASPNRPSTSEFLDMIILKKDIEDIREFLRKKSPEEARLAANGRLGSQTLLFRSVDSSNEPLVEALLKAGANTWAFEITSELPIHRAAARGHFGIMDHIITYMKPDRRPVDLQEYTFSIIQKLMENSKKQKEYIPEINHSKCFERLLKPDVLLNFNQTLEKGSSQTTPLHIAASFNNQEASSQLLSHGAFLGSRRVVMGKDYGNILGALLPSTLQHAMDRCITHHPNNLDDEENENIFNDDYTLDLDYSFLVPPVDTDSKEEAKSVNEMETLMEISKSKLHRPAIKHPLVQTLLYAKWRKALPLYLFNLLIYFIFVVILTAFVYSIKDLRILEARADSLKEKQPENSTLDKDIESKQTTVNVLMAFLIPCTIYMIIREVFQIYFAYSIYLKSIENYLEWILVVFVFILCIAPLDADSTRHLAAWAMIVAWYEFVLVLGRAPPLAIYITMLRHVSWNFLKLIFLYGALILAFTISFNIILQPSVGEENTEFSDFWTTLPKAIVMATGEFEYSDLNEHFSQKMLLLTSALLVFLLFLFLIFLVLMNVMNGLAVTDTQQVVDDAVLYSLTSRLELVYLIESLFLNVPGMRSYTSKVQLLTGSHNSPVLKAMINKINKGERLLAGKHHDQRSKLDDDTTNNLRTHRLQYLEDEERQRRGDPVSQCLSILQDLQDMAAHHPLVLEQTASSLRTRQGN
ncbi:transient receptor potential channel pyrexia-like isoform X2 [Palaemon carinicauda]|uniref:transient receptor potential channel pyrexia-like isoform X2 n=1 Tax=Palaemon carinicauda TaxID=392227 RepID=UPI0035B59448